MDNISAKTISNNPIYHNRSKYIDTKYYYIRDFINKEYLNLI